MDYFVDKARRTGSRCIRTLLLWTVVATAMSAGAATVTVSGDALTVQAGSSVCTYTGIVENAAGNWNVSCGSGTRTMTITPSLNGTVCTGFTSMVQDGQGNWTVSGCTQLLPTITLDAPAASGGTYDSAVPFTLKATPSVPGGRSVQAVEFRRDGTVIGSGSVSGSQYAYAWTAPVGTYSVTARVTDSTGASAESAPKVMIFAASPSGASIFYIHSDHLGTPREITRSSDNQIVWRWDNTEPFGNSAPNEDPSGLGAFTFNLRFPGQYFDAESGTNYNYFRDYDPTIGRYIESDPLGVTLRRLTALSIKQPLPGVGRGLNSLYGYVNASPLAWIDPKGLEIDAPPRRPPAPPGTSGGRRDCPLWGWFKLNTAWNGPVFGWPPTVLIVCVYDCWPPGLKECPANPENYFDYKPLQTVELMPGFVDGFKLCPPDNNW